MEDSTIVPSPEPQHDPRRWLDHVPAKRRSTVANWFHEAIRNGATTPADVCNHVSQTVQGRLEWAVDPEPRQVLQDIQAALHLDPAGALAYAASVLAYEQLPYEQRQRVKLERAFQYLKGSMRGKPATEAQHRFLRRLGYAGALPEDRADASEKIDALLQRQGGGR